MGMAMWVETAVTNETRLALVLGAQLGEDLHWDSGTQRLWGVAYWGAGCISCFPPDGRLLRRIGLSASNVTNVGIAGPGFDRLFVATAWFGLAGATQQAQPQAGDLFEELEPGVTGLPCLPAGLGWV